MRAPHPPSPGTRIASRGAAQTSLPSTDQVADGFAAVLADAAAARRAQLQRLPEDPSPVARAHRASVERILEAICSAQARLAAGTYGACRRCELGIDPESLRLRPWTATCDACGGR